MKKNKKSTKKDPLVSVILPTFNREIYVTPCLQSIKNQTYKNIEIIVVDQGSTDNTPKIAKQFGGRLIKRPKPKFYSPPSRSRNMGAKVAKGSIFVHLDSDMELSPKVIEEAVKKLSTEEFGALIIHEVDKTKGFWSKCKALERRCYWGDLNIEASRIVRRDVFEAVGGYEERLNSGDDLNVHKKYMEYSNVGFCKNVLYHNIGDLNFAKLMIKKFNYGKTAPKYFKETKDNAFAYFFEEYICYLKNYKIVFKDPLVGLGMLVMKSGEITSGFLGYVVGRTNINVNLNVYAK